MIRKKYTHWINLTQEDHRDPKVDLSDNRTKVTNSNFFYDWNRWEKLIENYSNEYITYITEEEVDE